MIACRSSLLDTYRVVLRDHLAQPSEQTLERAYELGRTCLNEGLGIIDLIRLHHQALKEGARSDSTPAAVDHHPPALESFLLEAVSPFEAAHRGFRHARERLQELNDELAERNEALALSTAQLEEEIPLREKAEAALRESKEHYFQLFQQAHAMQENLRDLSGQVLSAQEQERKRISRELHDEIGQALTAVNVAIALLKKGARPGANFRQKFAEAERLLAQSMEAVHRFARELRPAMIDHLGVQCALRSHLASFTERTGIKTEIIEHPNLSRINGPRGEVLFRVAQEALNNVFKHAEATAAKVEFSSTEESLSMEISDNGRAFNLEETNATKRTARLGLLGMQERVRLVDGTFAIESAPGRGTRIRVQIPFESTPAPGVAPDPRGGDAARSNFNLTALQPNLYEQNIDIAG